MLHFVICDLDTGFEYIYFAYLGMVLILAGHISARAVFSNVQDGGKDREPDIQNNMCLKYYLVSCVIF